MKATLILYIVMGALFLVPLILFNIRRIFVRKPPAPLKINWGRGLFVVLFSAFLVFFLVCAYRTTMESRYEIAAERIAEQHASMLAGNQSAEDFRQYVLDNGTEDVSESLRAADLTDLPVAGDQARFQISSWLTPKYWEEDDAYAQTEKLGDENPVYIMYRMEAGGQRKLYTVRMRKTDDGWKYDWFGNATEEQIKSMEKGRRLPSENNGKWHVVQADKHE